MSDSDVSFQHSDDDGSDFGIVASPAAGKKKAATTAKPKKAAATKAAPAAKGKAKATAAAKVRNGLGVLCLASDRTNLRRFCVFRKQQ